MKIVPSIYKNTYAELYQHPQGRNFYLETSAHTFANHPFHQQIHFLIFRIRLAPQILFRAESNFSTTFYNQTKSFNLVDDLPQEMNHQVPLIRV